MDLPEAPPATLLTAFLRAHAQRESVAAVLFAQGEDLYRRLSPSPPPIPEWGRFLVALGQLAADADDLQVASGYFMRAVRDAELHGDYEAALTAGYDQGVLFEARERPTHARAAYRAAAQEGFRLGALYANTLRSAMALVRLHFAEYGSLDAAAATLAKQAWLGWLWLRATAPETLDAPLRTELERTWCAFLLPDEPTDLAAAWRAWAPHAIHIGASTYRDDADLPAVFALAAEAADAQLGDEGPQPGEPYRQLAQAARRAQAARGD